MQNDKRFREYWKNLSDAPAQAADELPRIGRRQKGPRRDRKTLQLCGQVAETLNLVLSGECDDDVLRNVYVVRVEPAPDASQLLVTVAPYDPSDPTPIELILTRLGHASGLLRGEVARSISRRKAPQLLFRVLNPEDVLRELAPDVQAKAADSEGGDVEAEAPESDE